MTATPVCLVPAAASSPPVSTSWIVVAVCRLVMSKEPRDTNEPLINWRTVAIVLLVGLLFWSWVTPVSGEESVDDKKVAPRKLQIGIKKRVENCERKSRKGDLLHIHYRVSGLLLSVA